MHFHTITIWRKKRQIEHQLVVLIHRICHDLTGLSLVPVFIWFSSLRSQLLYTCKCECRCVWACRSVPTCIHRMDQVRKQHRRSSDPASLLHQGYPGAHCTGFCPDGSWISPVKGDSPSLDKLFQQSVIWKLLVLDFLKVM